MLSILEVGSQVGVIGFLSPVLRGVSLQREGNTSVRRAPEETKAAPHDMLFPGAVEAGGRG